MSEPNIKPGVPVSEADRAKLAESNAAESKAAVEQAREQMERDRMAGIPTNPRELQDKIAQSVKDKLEHDEFSVAVDESGNHIPARPAPKE